MHRVGLFVVLAVGGCGRLRFDAIGDGATDALPANARSIQLPGGGQMFQVVAGPDGTWYAVSKTAGAFRSDDEGAHWTRCGARSAEAVAVSSDNTVWVAGADVGRSTDRCATWTNTGEPRPTAFVFADGATVFALDDQGLVRWNGAQWANVPTPFDGTAFHWMAKSPTRYFVATLSGMLTSADGVTWSSATTGFADTNLQVVAAGPGHSYAISLGAPGGISCSDGMGSTWSVCYGVGGFSVAVDPLNDLHVVAGIYDDSTETTNGFNSSANGFREMSMDSALVLGLTYLPDGRLLAASDRGVFVAPASPLSPVFTPRNTGLDAWDIDRITRDGDDVWLTTRGGPLHSAAGAPFSSTTTGIAYNTNVFDIKAAPSGEVFAAGRMLSVSTDRGETWSDAFSLGAADGYRGRALLFVGSRLYVGTGARVLTSDPPYTTFTPHAFTGGAHDVAGLHATASGLWVGTTDGLFVSRDDLATFTAVPELGTSRVHAFAELADGSLVAASDDGMWRTDAAGTSWVRAGLDHLYLDGVIAIGDMLVAAGRDGVRYSRDRGATWAPVPGATTPASDVILDDTTGQLIVGTDDRGLVRVPMP